MEITASGIEELAASGERGFVRLVDVRIPCRIRRDRAWIAANNADLDGAIQSLSPGQTD
jgi:hypothetical protein